MMRIGAAICVAIDLALRRVLRDDAHSGDPGLGPAPELPVGMAVPCSAELHGALPTRWLRAGSSSFTGGEVHPPDSPWAVPSASGREPWPDDFRPRARAAEAALARPGLLRRQRTRIACENAAVDAPWWSLGAEVVAGLCHHAGVQTAVNLHVRPGHDLPSRVQTLDRFRADATGGAR